MKKFNVIYRESVEIYAKYYHPQSDDALEYKAEIEIKDGGKQPVRIKMTFYGMIPSFAPMPPERHTIKAKDLIDLYLKLDRWFEKYGYIIS